MAIIFLDELSLNKRGAIKLVNVTRTSPLPTHPLIGNHGRDCRGFRRGEPRTLDGTIININIQPLENNILKDTQPSICHNLVLATS